MIHLKQEKTIGENLAKKIILKVKTVENAPSKNKKKNTPKRSSLNFKIKEKKGEVQFQRVAGWSPSSLLSSNCGFSESKEKTLITYLRNIMIKIVLKFIRYFPVVCSAPYDSFISKFPGHWRRWSKLQPKRQHWASILHTGCGLGIFSSEPCYKALPWICLGCREQFPTAWIWARRPKWLPLRLHWCMRWLYLGRVTVVVAVELGEEANGASDQHGVPSCEEQALHKSYYYFFYFLDWTN